MGFGCLTELSVSASERMCVVYIREAKLCLAHNFEFFTLKLHFANFLEISEMSAFLRGEMFGIL